MKHRNFLLFFVLLALLTWTRADDAADDPPLEGAPDASEDDSLQKTEDVPTGNGAFLKKGKPKVTITEITPSHGPVTGDTRVTVRGQNFAKYVTEFPEPKCRFGSDKMIVNAAYTACTPKPHHVYELEGRRRERNATCVQCENTPASLESKPVEFTISLTGDFQDVESAAQFYFYKVSHVKAIKPHQGPKDGDTTVHVWGENFKDFGEDTICSFGTKSVKATIHDAGYITCKSPQSDVVQRAMPFSISLNGQQMTKDRMDYWYYNDPQVTLLDPDLGPETGGNEIVLRGDNFMPFKTELGEIDIQNSTFCAFLALNVRVKAIVTNSTRALCIAPPSYYWRETIVELTLNAQDYTDDGTKYYYYKPPFLFDVQPAQGPVEGGTKVVVVGSNFNNTGNITCKFGKKEVKGSLLSSSEIKCFSPPVKEPGYVDLAISLYPGLYSSPVKYLYYQNPKVSALYPNSGPMSGFTQISVVGQNFVDLGHNQAICVFNKTKSTNATVINDKLIICDSPSILNKQGYPEVTDPTGQFSFVEVSIDGGLITSKNEVPFNYYQQPKVLSVDPPNGPIKGGTTVTVHGSGFSQEAAYKREVRIGHIPVTPISYTNSTIVFKAPAVSFANTAEVAVSLNGQQYTSQPTVHDPSKMATYDYYSEPYISNYHPKKGPTNGGTIVDIQGYNFMMKRPHFHDKLWVRFVDPSSKLELAPPTQISDNKLLQDQLQWVTPGVKAAGEALVQVSLNNQDWTDVVDTQTDSSFTIYNSPHVSQISPSYGHVKATKDVTISLIGSGFECFDSQCSDLYCRFGNQPQHYIYVKGELSDSELVKCNVPQYTKPDVVNVELTINGESYTSDNRTFGFFDPFVLDAQPRLLSTDGSTQVSVKGLGFVDSGQTKSLFSNRTYPLLCGSSGQCQKTAQFKDKHTLVAPTFPQSEVKYQTSGKGVMWDPMFIDATVIGDEFTENQIEVFYYEDPSFSPPNIQEAPANVQTQLLIPTDFKMNNMERIMKYATPRCRFTSGSKVQFTEGQIVAYPFRTVNDPRKVNTIHCKTPHWNLDSDDQEKVTLDVSLNGQNFLGGLEFSFLKDLILHRDAPMASPMKTKSAVKLLGHGYRMHTRNTALKWGVDSAVIIPNPEVSDYTYNTDDFLNIIAGNQALRAYQNEVSYWPRVDTALADGTVYDLVTRHKTDIDESLGDTLGGPEYLEVGLDETFEFFSTDEQQKYNQTIYNFNPSSVEFYQYKDPFVQGINPTSGLTKGDTLVEVIGTWFVFLPEYGVVPHCRFGDKVVRAHYDSSVRLVCKSPANPNTTAQLPFEVSLNGVDWSTTGFTYSYYDEPVMTDIYPDMGSVNGGEDIYVRGEKFSNNTDPKQFKCRFSPTTLQIPPKIVRAHFVNSTTILCPSPGGWTEADRVILQVTWNGVDYDNNQFQYSFYSIQKAHPRSGPSNGKGGDIIIHGQGFREDTQPQCQLNNTIYEPLSVSPTQIRCPMPAAEGGDDYFGNVDFAVTANGITWNPFEGGFQYYQQPIVEDIDPKTGPSTGLGIINFYGQGFRSDYPLAELSCRIGKATGKAYFVSTRQIKCIVENIPLLTEDEEPLPAQVSLNNYSFTEIAEETYYRPYGVIQVQPSSGPIGGVTTVVVQGQGFMIEEGITPRCRFGTPANYAIVEAEILSYSRLACRYPENLPQTPTSALPRDIPFSIALSGDEFNPWTSTSHKVRFYEQPVLEKAEPIEIEIGRIVEVFITATEDSEFFEPMPLSPIPQSEQIKDQSSYSEQQEENKPTAQSPIKCKFGRFGESSAVFINQTTIKCTTPPTDEPADSVYRETVTLSLAMNGQDFLEDKSELEFTFIGTAPYISFATIMLILIGIAMVGIALALTATPWMNRPSIPLPSGRAQRGGIDGDLRVPL